MPASQLEILSRQSDWRIFDDFNRSDGAIGTAPVGSPWVICANNGGGVIQQPLISSGNCVVTDEADNTVATYFSQNLSSPIREMGGTVGFNGGVTNYANFTTIISETAANGLNNSHIVNGKCIHVSWTDALASIGYFDGTGAGISYYGQVAYTSACALDGTEYRFGFGVDYLASALNLFLPDGTVRRIYDARNATFGGNSLTFEHYKADPGGGNNASNPRICKVWAR